MADRVIAGGIESCRCFIVFVSSHPLENGASGVGHEDARDEFEPSGPRGVVGVNGLGDPLLVWTGRSVVRVAARDPATRLESPVAAGEPDVARVVVQP